MNRLLALALITLFSVPSYCLEPGDIAPEFSLQGTDGQIHRLTDYRGKETVVLAWFPKAYTRGCTIECKSLAENGHLLKKFAVSYFMVSVDPLEENIGFAEQQGADFPLLSDPSKQTAQAYEVLTESGVAARQTFYIGTDGRILLIDKKVKPASSAQDIASTLAKLGIPFASK